MIKKPLVESRPENCFWVDNGPVLKNLEELRSALEFMSEEQFYRHVNEEKNDFAKWVREILGEKELARKLARIKTLRGTFQCLKRELEGS